EDYLQLLVEKLPQSEHVKGAEVYIDGFHSFSPQELEIVRQLMICGARVTITLTIDEKTLAQPVNELDLFYETTLTYEKIKQVARE
ncbi:hypothetical protein JG666_22895, partial [Vibrio cholerae]|nr:hypothetical protein [Vibrio cholerae]